MYQLLFISRPAIRTGQYALALRSLSLGSSTFTCLGRPTYGGAENAGPENAAPGNEGPNIRA